jgi:hypothetical protein
MQFRRNTALAASLGSVVSLGLVAGCAVEPQVLSIAGNVAKTKVARPSAPSADEQSAPSFAPSDDDGTESAKPAPKRGEARVVVDAARVSYREITAIGVQGDALYIGAFERALDPVDSKRALLRCSIAEYCSTLSVVDTGSDESSSPFGMSKSGEDLFIYGKGALIKTYNRNLLRIKPDGSTTTIRVISEGLTPQTFYGVAMLESLLVIDGVFDIGPNKSADWYRSSLFSTDGGDALRVLKGDRASRYSTFATATRMFTFDGGDSKSGAQSGNLSLVDPKKGTLSPYLPGKILAAVAFGERIAGIYESDDAQVKRSYGHFVCESDSSCVAPARYAFAEREPGKDSLLGVHDDELAFLSTSDTEKATKESVTSLVSCSKDAMKAGPCTPTVISSKVLPHLGSVTGEPAMVAHSTNSLFYVDVQSRVVRVHMK